MMVEPGMDELLANVDSKYTLVSVSSKRARKIMEKDNYGLENPVTMALHEIADGKIQWMRTEDFCAEAEAEEEILSEETEDETADVAAEE